MPDFARSVTGAAGYRVPADDPSLRGVHAAELMRLQARLEQSSTGGGAGGGFQLDVEQMQSLLPQWRDLRDLLDRMRRDGEDLSYVQPPAGDESSALQNRGALTHAELYRRSVADQWTYADGYVKSLEKMIAKYEQGDESARDAFNVMGYFDGV
jgi:hypothetical protein